MTPAVLDAICDSAARLCGADLAGVFRVADGQLHEVSSWSRLDPEFRDMIRRTFPRPLDASTYIGRAILERRMVHVADMADPAAPQSATGAQSLRIPQPAERSHAEGR
jgi:GAF domain